ncbi:uncharacterized protein [Temnothorax longispinosus]|uniref:uncharacterized protein isoform X2 n=1 Tax=Temnothorax longispinosus TaxID=300112 RepID=UPI003A9937DF
MFSSSVQHSSSGTMEEDLQDVKLFGLVSFLDGNGSLESIYIIPKPWIWICSEESDNDLYCHYMDNTKDEKAMAKFRNKIEFCEPFEESWPLHRIEIRGSADSYAEAKIKLEQLNKASSAYSTNKLVSAKRKGVSAKQKAEKDTKKLKSTNIKYDLKTITEELEKAKTDFNDFLTISNEDTVDEEEVDTSSLRKSYSDSDNSNLKERESPIPRIRSKYEEKSPIRQIQNIISIEDSSSDENDSNRKQCVKEVRSKNKEEKETKTTNLMSNTEMSQILCSQSSNKNLLAENWKKNFKGQSFQSNQNRTPSKIINKEKDDMLLNRLKKVNKKAPADENNNLSMKENVDNDLINEKSNQNRTPSKIINKEKDDMLLNRLKKVNKKAPADENNNLSMKENVDNDLINEKSNHNRTPSKIINKEKDDMLLNRLKKVNKKAPADENNNLSMKENVDNDLINEKCMKTLMIKIHRSLSTQISRVKGEVIEIKNILDNSQLPGQNAAGQLESDAEDDEFKFPLTTYDVFTDFDEKLKTDQAYRRKIRKRIRSQINVKQDTSKNLGEIVRFFMIRLVALKFTAVKKMKDKELFKDTYLYKVLEGLFLSAHKESINSKQFQQLMGKVLNNAKDWDGFRFVRQQETIKNNNILAKKENKNKDEPKGKPKNNQGKDESDEANETE